MPTIIYDHFGPGLYIEAPAGDLNFSSQARISLNCLRSVPVGAALIKAICDTCAEKERTVVIEKSQYATAVPTDDTSDAFRALINQPGQGLLVDGAFAKTVRGKGGCKGAIARWNPSNTIPGTQIERPSFISLAHELIHCLHFIAGDCARAPTRQFDLKKDSGLAEEEARTVGLGVYDYPTLSEDLCENAFREAFKLSKREEYAPGVPLTQAVRTSLA